MPQRMVITVVLSCFIFLLPVVVHAQIPPTDEFFNSSRTLQPPEMGALVTRDTTYFIFAANAEVQGISGVDIVVTTIDDWLAEGSTFAPLFRSKYQDLKLPSTSFDFSSSPKVDMMHRVGGIFTLSTLVLDTYRKSATLSYVNPPIEIPVTLDPQSVDSYTFVSFEGIYYSDFYCRNERLVQTFEIQLSPRKVKLASSFLLGSATRDPLFTVVGPMCLLHAWINETSVFFTLSDTVLNVTTTQDGLDQTEEISEIEYLEYNSFVNSLVIGLRMFNGSIVTALFEIDTQQHCRHVIFLEQYTEVADTGSSIAANTYNVSTVSPFVYIQYNLFNDSNTMFSSSPHLNNTLQKAVPTVERSNAVLQAILDRHKCVLVVLLGSTIDQFSAFIEPRDDLFDCILECVDSSCLQCDPTSAACSVERDVFVPSDATVIITTPTIFEGDFTSEGEVILVVDDESTLLSVTGCLEILPNSSFSIDVSGVGTSSNTVLNVISSPCINGTVQVIAEECVEHEEQRSSTGLGLLLIVDKCSSSSVAIGLGITFGFLLLVAVFMVAVFVVKPLRKAIVPWSLRKARESVAMSQVNRETL
eukprot:CAMPEP_0168514064 /NCGR_PEP_ID=MMETSP0405-20121227/3875_1 /TAXON_ID=498012 /ORGANISM="Trichosphaerium sp, Strain Am-I-7 wt" /LENGTH=585 /DNA_ID=CAMNT_0008533095 /DNA_START=48 /DNA_END=1805 /DNA_ORIENTATION=-